MKICIVTDGGLYSTYGGGQVYCRNIINEFSLQYKKLNLDIIVISSEPNGIGIIPDYYNGIPIYKGITENDIEIILLKEKPNIVHANGNYQIVTHICKKIGIKSIITIHDSRWLCPNVTYLDPNEKLCSQKTSVKQCLKCELKQIRLGQFAYPFVKYIPIPKYIEIGKKFESKPFIWYLSPVLEAALKVQRKKDLWDEIITTADAVISISNRMAKMSMLNGLSEKKMFLVQNGTPKQLFNKYPNKTSILKFYYTGRICYSKGIHILTKAFHHIKNKNIELHLIGGGDSYRNRLIKKYRKDTRIIWHNEIKHNDINQYTKEMHVFVHPSIANETCSLSILEALSAGKFIIATKCGGPEDLVKEDINGWLVNPNNIIQLQSKIIQYINNPIVPQKLIFNDITNHIQQLVEVYSKVVYDS